MNRFKLSRYFSIASLAGITVTCVLLAFGFRHIAVDALTDSETRTKTGLVQEFSDSLWHRYTDFIQRAGTIPPGQLSDQPEIGDIREEVMAIMPTLNVVKVKIYDRNALTVFSTNPAEIGSDHGANIAIQRAGQGQIASSLQYRDSYDAGKQATVHRYELAIYIPMYDASHRRITGFFEVYSDMTGLMAAIGKAQNIIFLLAFVSFLALYLFLLLIVRRADRIIQQQAAERDSKERKIQYQTYHDLLTGLPNRSRFAECLTEAIRRSNFGEKPLAVMYLGLDRFKRLNDSLGHEIGDEYLKVAAHRLRASVRQMDSVFRMGSDEFTIILEDMDTLADASVIARRILKAMSLPFEVDDCEVIVTTSIGIAIYMQDGNSADTMVKNADAAMHHAKLVGRNNIKFFHQSMSQDSMEHLALEACLQRALDNDEFSLSYQPKIVAASGAVAGAEALLRWLSPKYGVVPPDKFIPLLEDSNLIVPVGEWVIETACRQSKEWQDSGLPPLRVSVNLSAQQFRQKSLPTIVHQILQNTGLDAKYLEIELTESMLMNDPAEAVVLMNKFKDIGITISVDDFGTGYSSLSYLKKFPIDYLKIDRSFINGVIEDEKDAAITRSIINLCKNLGIRLVAEGVESFAQYDFLTSLGCDEVQGYFFTRPLCVEDFTRYQMRQAGIRIWPNTG